MAGYDVVVVGGGIVGVATAMALAPRYGVVVLEAEDHLAAHQTGHNSGVIHSGLYYAPGSLKARNCTEGRVALERFCETHGIAFERCGKVVVATRKEELATLERLAERGHANGLEGIERLGPEQIRGREPHAAGIAGLFVPQTGIIDFSEVTAAFAGEVRAAGGEIVTSAAVTKIVGSRQGEIVAETGVGDFAGRLLVNCAGLQADRVARLCGTDPEVRIVPFRGEYRELASERRYLVKNLIYPVPDPRFPFLGVHFTRRISGKVEAGPNAVLALAREGYSRTSFSLRDMLETISWPGFRLLARRYVRTGLGEMARSWSTRAFVRALQRLMPEIEAADLMPGGAGVRAQALGRDGALVDDFHIVGGERSLHVLNAPSPAATGSIAIGRRVAAMAEERLV